VYRKGMKVTIITLFSGREWNLTRYTKALESLQWNHENLHLVAVDNGDDEKFGVKLRNSLANRGIQATIVVDTSTVIEGADADQFPDSAEQRMGNSYPLPLNLSKPYARKPEPTPSSTALVW